MSNPFNKGDDVEDGWVFLETLNFQSPPGNATLTFEVPPVTPLNPLIRVCTALK